MNLHTNTADFTALITFTAKHFNLIPAFVEKDYWITLALNRLSQSENVENAVFKGGTSSPEQINTAKRLSVKYPPSTIALLGAILETNSENEDTAVLYKALNHQSSYKLDISSEILFNQKKWHIK